MTVRPLSPIRRGANSLGRSPSIASISSAISSPSISPAGTNALAMSQEAQEATLAKQEQEPAAGSKKVNLRKLSLGHSFTLPQAPTSPLPSPSLPAVTASAATPTTPVAPTSSTLQVVQMPLPAVLARPHLAERAPSVRSMYADSIYDCYDYDSASEYELPTSDTLQIPSRQGSFSSTTLLSAEQDLDLLTVNKKISASVTTTTATGNSNKASTLTVSSGHGSKNAESVQETQVPLIRLRSNGAPKDEPVPSEEEQQHVHYEDLPKAVEYRMSMMTTVPVEPVGVAASMTTPLRPPRHPMRQSRQGSVNTLNITDSWVSSSARYTGSDMSGWDERSELDRQDEDQLSDMIRRPSNASTLSHVSYGSRSERTMSMMTDRSQTRVLDLGDDAPLRRRASEASSVRFPRNSDSTPKQWRKGMEERRETWGSVQSSSSDSATTSSSAPSSQFYFNGRSPSPTEESASATNAF